MTRPRRSIARRPAIRSAWPSRRSFRSAPTPSTPSPSRGLSSAPRASAWTAGPSRSSIARQIANEKLFTSQELVADSYRQAGSTGFPDLHGRGFQALLVPSVVRIVGRRGSSTTEEVGVATESIPLMLIGSAQATTCYVDATMKFKLLSTSDGSVIWQSEATGWRAHAGGQADAHDGPGPQGGRRNPHARPGNGQVGVVIARPRAAAAAGQATRMATTTG